MEATAVFKLLPIVDTPRHQCLATPDLSPVAHGRTVLSDFVPPDVSSRQWQMPRLAPVWRRRRVVNPLPGQVNDYPCLGLTVPTFSQRAVDALRDLLEPNGELLPLDCDTGSYFAYNVTTVADVLDRAESEIQWPLLDRPRKKESVIAEDIHHYCFVSEGILDLAVFRIPEDMVGYYVTERFVERVRTHDLQGFRLRKVWPLPRPRTPGGVAEMERRARLRGGPQSPI